MNSLGFGVFVTIATCTLMIVTVSTCPGVRYIYFQPAPGKKCEDLPGAEYRESKECRFIACPDLLPGFWLNESNWCSARKIKSDCNLVGNNCEGGCNQLDDWGRKTVAEREKMNMTTTLVQLFEIKYAVFINNATKVYAKLIKLMPGNPDYELYSDRLIVDEPILPEFVTNFTSIFWW